MDILVLGSFFYFGVILAQYFKFYVLVPAFVLAIILVLISPTHLEYNLLGWGFQIVGVMTSLQLGCVAGLILHAVLQQFRGTSASTSLTASSKWLGHRTIRAATHVGKQSVQTPHG
jgi:hypothetical protein